MRTRHMSSLGGPYFRLPVEYLPRWFKSHHSAVCPRTFCSGIYRSYRQLKTATASRTAASRRRAEIPPQSGAAAPRRRGGGVTPMPRRRRRHGDGDGSCPFLSSPLLFLSSHPFLPFAHAGMAAPRGRSRSVPSPFFVSMRSCDGRSRCCCRLVRCRERIPSFDRLRHPLFQNYFGIVFVLDAEQPVQNLCQAGARRHE